MMKASLKFREDQKPPLLRTKVPINVLGFPFQSGVAAGESKELSLQLNTFFDSGPSLKITYRPNDAFNPFSLIMKIGTGAFGSPTSSSMTMSAEFNLIGRGNPSFSLHFKPRVGDFSLKKSHSSCFVKKKSDGAVSDSDELLEVVERPAVSNGFKAPSGLITSLPRVSTAGSTFDRLISGTEVGATTSLPVRNRAVLRFRWGLKFPAELKSELMENRAFGVSFQKIPLLVMNKISIENVVDNDAKESKAKPERDLVRNIDVAEMCLGVKRDLAVLKAENGLLRKAVENLQTELAGGSNSEVGAGNSGRQKEAGNRAHGGKSDRRSEKKTPELEGYGRKGTEAKALPGASSGA